MLDLRSVDVTGCNTALVWPYKKICDACSRWRPRWSFQTSRRLRAPWRKARYAKSQSFLSQMHSWVEAVHAQAVCHSWRWHQCRSLIHRSPGNSWLHVCMDAIHHLQRPRNATAEQETWLINVTRSERKVRNAVKHEADGSELAAASWWMSANV